MPPTAPATEPGSALLLWGHGADGGPGVLRRHAERLAASGRFAEVGACCLRGRPGLAEALARLATPRVCLLPMLLADGYLARTALAAELRRLGPAGERLRLAPVLGSHPGLAALLRQRGEAVVKQRGWRTAACTLLLVGHGTSREPASGGTLMAQAERIRRQGGFAGVATAFLEDRPDVAAALRDVPCGNVAAVGFFMESGPHGERDVHRALARTGPPVAYAGVIGAAPELAALALELAALAEPPAVAA